MRSINNRIWWIVCSGVGALVGASIAMQFFPGAAFAENPTGEFGWHLVGFAVSVGAPFAVAQWTFLRIAFRPQLSMRASVLDSWLPVSTLGIVVVIFPLWWTDAYVLFIAPWTVVVLMMPGSLVLGLGQWFVLNRLTRVNLSYVVRTVLGVALGGLVGLIVATWTPLPLEYTWAFLFGTITGALQGRTMAECAGSVDAP